MKIAIPVARAVSRVLSSRFSMLVRPNIADGVHRHPSTYVPGYLCAEPGMDAILCQCEGDLAVLEGYCAQVRVLPILKIQAQGG